MANTKVKYVNKGLLIDQPNGLGGAVLESAAMTFRTETIGATFHTESNKAGSLQLQTFIGDPGGNPEVMKDSDFVDMGAPRAIVANVPNILTLNQGMMPIRAHYTPTVASQVQASLDLAPVTAGPVTTVLEASPNYPGTAGNAITLELKADGVGAGNLTGIGTAALVFHYQATVTTAANLEAAISAVPVAQRTAVVKTPGAGTFALADAAVRAFTGGIDNEAYSVKIHCWGFGG